MAKASIMTIKAKVEREHLFPRQIEMEMLLKTIKPTDKPSPRSKNGTLHYRQVMQKVNAIRKSKTKIEAALDKKLATIARQG